MKANEIPFTFRNSSPSMTSIPTVFRMIASISPKNEKARLSL